MRTAAEFVLSTLRKAGFEAFMAGGCVRDMVLGRNPKDFDITTNARPEQVTPLFEKTIPVGAKFGVVVVMIDGHQIEVATYRADGAYSDGRRPDEVRYSDSAQEDVERRDFTMNGLLSLTTFPAPTVGITVEDNGISDFVGGQDDIKAKLIRAIGDPNKRFEEDKLRMLRAVRFVAQLGFEIEAETFKAIQANAAGITTVSRERVAEELKKLTTGEFAAKGLSLLANSGLLRHALPGLATAQFAITLERFGSFSTKDPVMGLAMLLADTDSNEVAAEVCNSLKLSTFETEALLGAVRHQAALGFVTSPEFGAGAEAKLLAREKGVLPYAVDLFEQNLGLGFLFLRRDNGMEAGMEAVKQFRGLTPEEIRPVPMVTGNDLIAMGFKPSPLFTRVLNSVEVGQLNGYFASREEALEYALQLATDGAQ